MITCKVKFPFLADANNKSRHAKEKKTVKRVFEDRCTQ